MQPKKPAHVSIEQVRIKRNGPTAVIDYADPTYGGVNLTIGDHLAAMSDQQIVDVLNDVLDAQAQSLRDWDNTVTEIPVGKPQIKFNRDTGQWVPRGEVLRCVIGGLCWLGHAHRLRAGRAGARAAEDKGAPTKTSAMRNVSHQLR